MNTLLLFFLLLTATIASGQYFSKISNKNNNKFINVNKQRINEDFGPATAISNTNNTATRDDTIVYDFKNYFTSNATSSLEILAEDSKDSFLKHFYINQNEHTLCVNRTNLHIDREVICHEKQHCEFELKIALYYFHNANKRKLSNLFIVPIEIADLNDNAPTFKHPVYYLNISENLVSNLSIPLEARPYDLDQNENENMSCFLNGSEYENIFEIKQNKLQLYLHVMQSLDRERVSKYSLMLACADSASFSDTAQTNLIINVVDSNDNVPYFDAYSMGLAAKNITFRENHHVSSIAQVKCLDQDDPLTPNGQLIYKLADEDGLNTPLVLDLFHVDEQNGLITLKKEDVLFDYEKEKYFQLKVKCQDRGASNSMPVYITLNLEIIDENDNAPKAHFNFLANDDYLVRRGEEETSSNSTFLMIWIDEYDENTRFSQHNHKTLGNFLIFNEFFMIILIHL